MKCWFHCFWLLTLAPNKLSTFFSVAFPLFRIENLFPHSHVQANAWYCHNENDVLMRSLLLCFVYQTTKIIKIVFVTFDDMLNFNMNFVLITKLSIHCVKQKKEFHHTIQSNWWIIVVGTNYGYYEILGCLIRAQNFLFYARI